MAKHTCHKAFADALAERAKYPLTEGIFKIEEARRDIAAWRALVLTITARLRTGDKFGANENLGPCMAHERETYLKDLPVQMAELVGYKVLPAIAALEGDGVPKSEVHRLLAHAQNDAQRLLDDCETVRLQLAGGIEREYRAMKNGWSHMWGLLDAAADLAQPRPPSS
jgi:hypothetical protein